MTPSNGGFISPITRRPQVSTPQPRDESQEGLLTASDLQLRQATFILPKSGQRVKRNVTFGPPPAIDGTHDAGTSDRSSSVGKKRHGSQPSYATLLINTAKEYSQQAWVFANSKTGHGILKCSIAYFLGSLATFVPFIAALLGQQDGKHMVATITVYFHPARSRGSMVEAIACAVVAFMYAVFICFSSMGVSIFFGRTLGLIVLGHVIVLIVFCGGGLGFVGWTKQRLGHPLVNISCSLTSLAIITVVTKEGAVQAAEFSDDKVLQVMKMIIMGVIATTAVSLLIWPVSAKEDLKKDLIQVTDSFGELLTMITRGFLTGSEDELRQQRFLDAYDKYKKVFDSLTKNLKEAKYEHYFVGTEREYRCEAELVNCVQRLAQNIGGLRSAANTQFVLLAQTGVSIPQTPSSTQSNTPLPDFSSLPPESNGTISPSEEHGVLAAVDEASGDESPEDSPLAQLFSDVTSLAPTIRSPSDIFSRFIMQSGPSMVSIFPIVVEP